MLSELKVKFHLEKRYEWDNVKKKHLHVVGVYKNDDRKDWHLTLGDIKKELGNAFYNGIANQLMMWVSGNGNPSWLYRQEIRIKSNDESYYVIELRVED